MEFDLGIGDVRDRDLIIGCLDSVNARWAINQLAYRAGIPWINGGIGVAEGEVSFFDPNKSTACYECSISKQMWQRRDREIFLPGDETEYTRNCNADYGNNCLNGWSNAGAASYECICTINRVW